MKKILCAMLSVFVLTCCACAGDLSAGSAILIDADSGEALFEKKPDERSTELLTSPAMEKTLQQLRILDYINDMFVNGLLCNKDGDTIECSEFIAFGICSTILVIYQENILD